MIDVIIAAVMIGNFGLVLNSIRNDYIRNNREDVTVAGIIYMTLAVVIGISTIASLVGNVTVFACIVLSLLSAFAYAHDTTRDAILSARAKKEPHEAYPVILDWRDGDAFNNSRDNMLKLIKLYSDQTCDVKTESGKIKNIHVSELVNDYKNLSLAERKLAAKRDVKTGDQYHENMKLWWEALDDSQKEISDFNVSLLDNVGDVDYLHSRSITKSKTR